MSCWPRLPSLDRPWQNEMRVDSSRAADVNVPCCPLSTEAPCPSDERVSSPGYLQLIKTQSKQVDKVGLATAFRLPRPECLGWLCLTKSKSRDPGFKSPMPRTCARRLSQLRNSHSPSWLIGATPPDCFFHKLYLIRSVRLQGPPTGVRKQHPVQNKVVISAC